MSQPPANFDPTATLLPRVDAPISVQTGGSNGYYDIKMKYGGAGENGPNVLTNQIETDPVK